MHGTAKQPRRPRVASRSARLSLLVALVLLALFAVSWLLGGRGKGNDERTLVTIAHGELANGIPAITLGSVTPGYCTYVVLYSATCAAARRMADHWLNAWKHDSTPLPTSWRVIFVALDSVPVNDPLATPDFPWPVFSPADRWRFQESFGLTAVPAHIILGQSGHIREVGLGATLWQSDRYGADCSIHEAR